MGEGETHVGDGGGGGGQREEGGGGGVRGLETEAESKSSVIPTGDLSIPRSAS